MSTIIITGLLFSSNSYGYNICPTDMGGLNMDFVDVFNVKHENCKIVETRNEFNRIFIIENEQGERFTCLKENAPIGKKFGGHWKHANPQDSPEAHPFRNRF